MADATPQRGPRRVPPMRERCEHSGLMKPECSCRACFLEMLNYHGTQAVRRWLGEEDRRV